MASAIDSHASDSEILFLAEFIVAFRAVGACVMDGGGQGGDAADEDAADVDDDK